MDPILSRESTLQLSRCNSIMSDDSYEASSLASICPETPASGGLSPMQGTIAPNVLSRGMMHDFLPIEQEDQDVMSFFDHRTQCFPCVPHPFPSGMMKDEGEESYVPSSIGSPASSSGMVELAPSSYWTLASDLASLRTSEHSDSVSPPPPTQAAARAAATMALNYVIPKEENDEGYEYFGEQLQFLEKQGPGKRLIMAKREQRRRRSSVKKPLPMEVKEKFPLVVNELNKSHHCKHQGCTSRFKRQEHLRRHEKTHTGEKPHTCIVPTCDRKFSRSDNLRAHLRTHAKTGGRNKFVEGLQVNVMRRSRHVPQRCPI